MRRSHFGVGAGRFSPARRLHGGGAKRGASARPVEWWGPELESS
jgi:hypothetical protein